MARIVIVSIPWPRVVGVSAGDHKAETGQDRGEARERLAWAVTPGLRATGGREWRPSRAGACRPAPGGDRGWGRARAADRATPARSTRVQHITPLRRQHRTLDGDAGLPPRRRRAEPIQASEFVSPLGQGPVDGRKQVGLHLIPHHAAQGPRMRASTATIHSVIRSRAVPHR